MALLFAFVVIEGTVGAVKSMTIVLFALDSVELPEVHCTNQKARDSERVAVSVVAEALVALAVVAFWLNEPMSFAWIEHEELSSAGVKVKPAVELFEAKPSAGVCT